ncbi:MAG TPA: hypothetical protein VK611_13585 [Acidimicrobiales bacterium]|nr:hypothetical protein [Acidimicrobiales bacterium]
MPPARHHQGLDWGQPTTGREHAPGTEDTRVLVLPDEAAIDRAIVAVAGESGSGRPGQGDEGS